MLHRLSVDDLRAHGRRAAAGTGRLPPGRGAGRFHRSLRPSALARAARETGGRPLSLSAIDLTAVVNSENEDHQHSVVDLVDDAVVAGAHAPLPVPSDEFFGTYRARLLGKQLNDSLNPALRVTVQFA